MKPWFMAFMDDDDDDDDVVVVVVGRNKDWGPVENNNFLTLGILWCSLRAFTQVPAVLKNNFGGDNPHVFDSDV